MSWASRGVIITLGMMIFMTITLVLMGNSVGGQTVANSYTSDFNGSQATNIVNTQFPLDLTSLTGVVIWIGIIAAVGVACGIIVVSSGLSDNAQHWLTMSIFYTTMWTIFSLLPAPALGSIPILGILIYVTLTIIYAICVIVQISDSSSGGGA